MKQKLICLILVCLILMLGPTSALAEVRTAPAHEVVGIAVAGHTDYFPLEYYDKSTQSFDGVMPRILKLVSRKTGLHFTYLDDPRSQTELANEGVAELVSAYIVGSNYAFAHEKMTALSYTVNERTVNVGFAFTPQMDDATVALIENAVAGIAEDEINGILLDIEQAKTTGVDLPMIMVFSICVLFLFAALLLFVRLEKTKIELNEIRLTDAETGIGNLAFFEQRFKELFEKGECLNYHVAYIIVDHNVLQLQQGDSALSDAAAYAAGEMKASVIEGDFFARITESGFAYAFQADDSESAEKRMGMLLRRLNTLNDSAGNKAKPAFFASYYQLTEDDSNLGLLLFNLRRNCNIILGSDKIFIACNAEDMNSTIEEQKLMGEIDRGLRNREFEPYLQFIVDNKSQKIVSAEILSRWNNPNQGLLLPGRYIGALEAAGRINELDYYMFEQACLLLHKWRDTDLDDISVSCNFTRMTLSDENFVARIRDISVRYVFEHRKLIMEMTEDTIETNREAVTENVQACKDMGFRIALDDMGSGYTSLTNLCEYPVDVVKLDRDILLKVQETLQKSLIDGLVALVHRLDKRVICEGVENAVHEALIKASECDYIQGWYYSKPLPVEESERFYRDYQKQLGGEMQC